MIRKMRQDEIDTVGEIWLHGNLEAHDFVDKNYWLNYLDDVKEQFKQADIYIYEEHGIQGFAGLKDDYIAGIFINKTVRSQGIGKKLLDYLKQRYAKLTLDVYAKNTGALKFYQKNNFKIAFEDVDKDNDEKEFQMIWTKE